MTVTMYNPNTKITVIGVTTDYINKWIKLGFEVKEYDSPKIAVFNRRVS